MNTEKSFNDYSLSEELLKSISLLGYENPTHVQDKVIPEMLAKKDIVVKSQTGTGKTASFAIPICEMIEWGKNKPQVLVLAPTRELAIQVKEDIFNLGRFKRIKVAAVYGRESFSKQERELKQKTHVVVGTPGRLVDHIEKETIDLSEIEFLIVDEADEMFKMGFLEQMESILDILPKSRVNVVLSATMPEDVDKLFNKNLKSPVLIEIENTNPALEKIEQIRYEVEEEDKFQLLRKLTVVENPDSCIIFCNTKDMVDDVFVFLRKQSYPIERIHGGMEQKDRLKVMNKFKRGYFRYLVATDVAARGIDIDSISLVINYEIPIDPEVYVHRIGRTGRIGKAGRALTIMTEKENYYLENIQEYIGKEIPLGTIPEGEEVFNSEEAFKIKINAQPKIKQSKDEEMNKEILKIHINAGKKTKMRAVDIVGTLCNIEGMTADDIGVINIMDISTFVEILNNKGEMVFKELQNRPIKGRVRKVSKGNIRPY